MIHTIDHASINVSDLSRSIDFYCNKLGFRVSRTIDTPELNIVFVQLGASSLELIARKDRPVATRTAPRTDGVGLAHVALRVSDIDEVFSQLKEKGVEFSSPPHNATGEPRIAFFSDPDGVTLELIQWQQTRTDGCGI
jgi:lactoylglutathione lyase